MILGGFALLASSNAFAGGTSQWTPSGSSTNWHSNSNWSNGVPSITTEAEIGASGNGTISIGTTNATADHLRLLSSATRDWTVNGSATLNLDTDQSGGTGYTVANESNGYLLTVNTNLNLSNSTSPGGDDSKFFASTGNIIVNGNINFNGVNPYVDASSGQSVTFNGALSGSSTVTKQGAGSWVIGGSTGNTYSGGTVINGGTVTLNKTSGNAIAGSSITLNSGSLILNNDNQIGNSTNLTLAGGNFYANDKSDVLGSLTLSTTSTLDLGSDLGDGSTLAFSDSSGNAWNGSLYITGWTGDAEGGGLDQLIFGNSSSGLTSSQINSIYFVNPWGTTGIYEARILGSGEVVPVLPEPSTYAFGAFLLGAAFVYHRRQKKVAAPEALLDEDHA